MPRDPGIYSARVLDSRRQRPLSLTRWCYEGQCLNDVEIDVDVDAARKTLFTRAANDFPLFPSVSQCFPAHWRPGDVLADPNNRWLKLTGWVNPPEGGNITLQRTIATMSQKVPHYTTPQSNILPNTLCSSWAMAFMMVIIRIPNSLVMPVPIRNTDHTLRYHILLLSILYPLDRQSTDQTYRKTNIN